jgi:hypothetical protein
VTQPAGTSIGPTYSDADRLTFVRFTPAQQRALRSGGLAKARQYVPRGFTLDHVANGGMYLRSTSGVYAPSGPTVAESDKVVAQTKAKQAAQQQQIADAYKVQHAWVDGQFVTLTQDAQGNWIAAPVGGGDKRPLATPSAFAALDGESIDETTPFLMSHFRLGSPSTPGVATGKPSQGGMFANLLHTLGTGAEERMTIGGGVAWLASLSTKDPGAYQALLDKLHNANYLSDADLASAAGHWSPQVGKAFARAALDVAVVNTTDAGRNTTLDEFLTSKQGAYAAGQGAGKGPYVPAERRYTDPTTIVGTAKNAAAQLLGRQLTPEEEQQLTGHFRGLEDAAYDQVDAAGRQEQNARFTPPDLGGQVDTFLDSGPREQEQANFRAAQLGQAIKRLFGVATGG